MTQAIAEGLPQFLALFCRVAAFSYAAPVVGDRAIPSRFRVAVAVLLALSFSTFHPPQPISVVAAIPMELVLGFLLGFTARVILAGVEVAGELVGLNMGIGFASTFDPNLGETALPVRRIAGALGALAFMAAGGIQAMAGILALPPADPWTLFRGTHDLIRVSGQMFELGLWMSAPMVAAVIVANVAMGLASRAAPALNVFSVMLALTAVVGAFILLATSSSYVGQLQVVGARAVDGVLGRAGL